MVDVLGERKTRAYFSSELFTSDFFPYGFENCRKKYQNKYDVVCGLS